MNFPSSFQCKVIYIFSIDDAAHKGLLKIGDTTLKDDSPDQAARNRINQYTRTAGINFNLLYTEIAVRNDGSLFRDYDVHHVLKKYKENVKGTTGREWFRVDLSTAVKAVKAVKLGRKNLSGMKSEEIFIPIDFRPEQRDAVNITVKHFKKNNKFLWNAKMRFGKTLCALQVAKEMHFNKTIIITHRPVVNVGWYDDFNKIFGDTDYIYLTKDDDIAGVENNFVYFASLQDLRGSEIVGGKYDKNSAVFNTDWDFVIVDEAHEGTTTKLGDDVIKNILKPKSKFLALSGTPFNILNDYDDNVYTWDYIMEQRAKAAWNKDNLDSNPYDELPQMNIYTYRLGDYFDIIEPVRDNHFDYIEPVADKAFNFREFFRTDGENFVHAADVQRFLDLLIGNKTYPYSRADYRELFKHSLWIIPGVKEGRALSKILKRHKVFGGFGIVNVAGDGDSDDEPADALKKVQDAIADNEYTITLSCGKLTMGVTVPEWTAVFMLAGGSSTSAASYLQTIFRVQSPCNKDGKVKQNAYVFDFAPDRTLKMVAESVAISACAGQTKDGDRKILDDFLNFCPVIAVDGSRMKNYNADNLLQQLKQAWIKRVVLRGFDDNSLYNNQLLNLSELDLKKFDNLRGIIGTQKKSSDIIINNLGLDNEQHDKKSKGSKRQRSPEEKELDRRKKIRANAISILRGISIRMPLMIYGADIPFDEDLTIEQFPEIIDNASWLEFMPKGVTKEIFKDFIKYYDKDIFIAAGRRIRDLAKSADDLAPADRVKKVAEIFSTFKNPDKETVLTPYNVVMLHIDSAFDENFFTADKKILEINSKTGLYPLYVAYKIYRARLGNFDEENFKPEFLIKIWDAIVADNVFVICKTPMAEAITKRTLVGYRAGSVNARCFENLIDTLKVNPDDFIGSILDKSFWNKGVGTMFFDGVVGNPPYQVVGSGDNKNYAAPIYHEFIKIAYNEKLTKKASLIHPARFLFNAGATPGDFAEKFLQDNHVKIIKHFMKSWEYELDGEIKPLFPNTDIKGGVAITLYDKNQTFEPIKIFIPFEELASIYKKVVVDNKNFRPLSEIMYSRTAYSLTPKAHEDFPDAVKKFSKGNQYQMSSNVFDLMSEIFFDEKPNDGHEYIQLYGRKNNERVFKWVRRDYVTYHESLEKFKVFVPDSNGSGALGEVVSTPLVGLPLVGCTQTFITVGAFDTRAEAEACIAYIKSKFCRAMLGILKVTQHNPPATWAMVPLQDFTAASDINWNVPIPEIDKQLYAKYNLDDAEINFIEERVKAMA